MKLINFFKRPSTAPVARERLQLLLAHERAVSGKSDLIAILQEEIMAVIAKHFPVEQEGIKVKMERGEVVSTLEVEVEIPTPMCPRFPLPAKAIVPVKPVLSEESKPACAESEPACDEPDTEMARTGT
jgi:cell division topological specificity factor